MPGDNGEAARMCNVVHHAIADLPGLLTMLSDSPSATSSSEAANAHGVSYRRLSKSGQTQKCSLPDRLDNPLEAASLCICMILGVDAMPTTLRRAWDFVHGISGRGNPACRSLCSRLGPWDARDSHPLASFSYRRH